MVHSSRNSTRLSGMSTGNFTVVSEKQQVTLTTQATPPAPPPPPPLPIDGHQQKTAKTRLSSVQQPPSSNSSHTDSLSMSLSPSSNASSTKSPNVRQIRQTDSGRSSVREPNAREEMLNAIRDKSTLARLRKVPDEVKKYQKKA